MEKDAGSESRSQHRRQVLSIAETHAAGRGRAGCGEDQRRSTPIAEERISEHHRGTAMVRRLETLQGTHRTAVSRTQTALSRVRPTGRPGTRRARWSRRVIALEYWHASAALPGTCCSRRPASPPLPDLASAHVERSGSGVRYGRATDRGTRRRAWRSASKADASSTAEDTYLRSSRAASRRRSASSSSTIDSPADASPASIPRP